MISNATDALDGTRDPAIVLDVYRSGARVIFQVINNGRGMSEEQHANLFRPFAALSQG